MENTYDNNTLGELKIQYNLECILKFYFFTTNIEEFPNSKHQKNCYENDFSQIIKVFILIFLMS